MTTDLERRLRALRDDLPEPPHRIEPEDVAPDAEVAVLAAATPSRARRTRWVVAALVAAALVAGVAVAVGVVRDGHHAVGVTGSTDDALPGRLADQVVRDGDRVRGSGRVYAAAGRPVYFCATGPVIASGAARTGPVPAVSTSPGSPARPVDTCAGGVEVTGVDLDALTDRQTSGNAVTGYADLVGTYRTGRVAVDTTSRYTGSGADAPPSTDDGATTCRAPHGGWPQVPPDTAIDSAALRAYAAAHPAEVLGISTYRPSRTQAVAYLVTSGDVAAAESALRPAYGAGLCVAHTDAAPSQLDALYTAYLARMSSRPGGDVGGVDHWNLSLHPVVTVHLTVVTRDLAALAADHPDLVRFDPFLTRVVAPSPSISPSALVVHDGDRVEGDGQIVAVGGQPLAFCSLETSDLSTSTDPFHDCHHRVEVTGVDLAHLYARETHPADATSAAWVAGLTHLTGTCRGDRLTDVVQAPFVPPDPDSLPQPPCPAPSGGWPRGPADENVDITALDAYVTAHPGEVVVDAELRPSSTQVVVYVLTDVDPAPVEASLTPSFRGRLCVVRTRHPRSVLDAAARAFDLSTPSSRAAGVWSVAPQSLTADGQVYVEVDLPLVTPAMVAAAGAFPAGLVQFEPWLGRVA